MNPVAAILAGLSLLVIAQIAGWLFVAYRMPCPAEAQPDYTPLDEKWYATAALDPRDSTDLPSYACHAGPHGEAVDQIIGQAWLDYATYRRRQHLPGEHHYSEGTP